MGGLGGPAPPTAIMKDRYGGTDATSGLLRQQQHLIMKNKKIED